MLFLATAGLAQASGLCDRLYQRLDDLPRRITSVERVEDTGAITRQNIELRRARIELRRLGCSAGSIIVIGGPNEAACSNLEQAVAGMQRNLDRLKDGHERRRSGGPDDIIRRRILISLQVNRCEARGQPLTDENRDQEAVIEASTGPREGHRNIISNLPPISESADGMMMRGGVDFEDITTPRHEDGGLRTMCVRTCDGAFFPISSNATSADFSRDAQSCRQRCPGAETELYYHKLETEEADQMVSAATGEPYSELPNAFAYKTRDPGTPGICGCRLGKAASAEQSAPLSPSVVDLSKAKVEPEREIATTPALQKPEPAPARPYDPGKSPVRIVGPTFLPPQESAIDLQHPKGPGYQPQQTN